LDRYQVGINEALAALQAALACAQSAGGNPTKGALAVSLAKLTEAVEEAVDLLSEVNREVG